MKLRTTRLLTVAAVLLFGVTVSAEVPSDTGAAGARGKPLTGEQINWQVISGGGNQASSAGYILAGTIGQTAVGQVSSTGYRVYQGFWQNFVTGSCCTTATTGDVDASGSVDISDLSAMVDYLFNGLPFPGTCFQEQDVDLSGAVDISDLQAIIDFLFNGTGLPNCP